MTPIQFEVPGPPRGKGVARKSTGKRVDGTTFTRMHPHAPTVAYESLVKKLAFDAMQGQPPTEGPVSLSVLMVFPIAAGWSKRRQQAAMQGMEKPTRKPDCSNVLKAIEDGCNGVVFKDDAQVVRVTMRKKFGVIAQVLVDIRSA